MVSVSLPFDALSQHLPSFLGFSYLGHRISLPGCSRKAQLLSRHWTWDVSLRLLQQSVDTYLDEGYLLMATPPDKRRDYTRGQNQMVNTEIRVILFFAAKDGEALYSQQNKTVAQIINSLLQNSDLN